MQAMKKMFVFLGLIFVATSVQAQGGYLIASAYRSNFPVPAQIVKLAEGLQTADLAHPTMYSSLLRPGSAAAHRMLWVEMHRSIMTAEEIALDLIEVDAFVLDRLARDLDVDLALNPNKKALWTVPTPEEIEARIVDAHQVSDQFALECALNIVRQIETALPGYSFSTRGDHGDLLPRFSFDSLEREEVLARLLRVSLVLDDLGLEGVPGSLQKSGIDPMSFSIPSIWRHTRDEEVKVYLASRLSMLLRTFYRG